MRSTWSAEVVLAFLAAASVEAAALTVAYLGVSWLGGSRDIQFGIPTFALAVGAGLILARLLRRSSWDAYLIIVPSAAVLIGVAGAWLAAGGVARPLDPVAMVRDPGGWLLGIGLLRGTTHAELTDERFTIERLNRVVLPGIVVFWILGAATGLTGDPSYTGAAFGATLTFVSSALFGIGLARLGELQVEQVDQSARRRWLALLLGVSAVLLLVGLPLAALLQVPLSTAAAGAAGPLATVVIVLFSMLATPILVLLSTLIDLVGHVDLRFDVLTPSATGGSGGESSSIDLVTIFSVVLAAAVVIDLLVILVIVAAVLRRRRRRRRPIGVEVREGEPIELGGLGQFLHLPRGPRLPRWSRAPADAVEAYRLSLAALAGGEAGRRLGETPREHARRIRPTDVGGAVSHLAADYQLRALGERRLTDAEERRAKTRWQRIRRWAR